MIGFILGGVAVIALIGYSYFLGGENAVANYKEKLEAVNQRIEAADKKAVEVASNHIIDMTAAFDAGEANAKTVEKKIYVRVGSDLTKYPVFQNPACALPESSYALLTAALRGTRSGITLPPEILSPASVVAPATPITMAPPASSSPVSAGGAPPKPVPRKKAGP